MILFRKWVRRLVFAIIGIIIAGLFFYGSYLGYLRRHQIDVLENLDMVAAEVDGEELTLQDLGFYILFEEHKVEEEALVYNDKRSKDFWNIHTNGFFLQAQAKDAVIKMAIHDRIFYRASQEAGIVLTSEEKQTLEDSRTDFWADLFDIQHERIPGTYESVNETMKEIALAQKYQIKLSEALETTYAGLNWTGYDYEHRIVDEHDIRINDRVWDRVILGDITLVHEDVSYLNAFDEEPGQ